jgi:hypothetical protein
MLKELETLATLVLETIEITLIAEIQVVHLMLVTSARIDTQVAIKKDVN